MRMNNLAETFFDIHTSLLFDSAGYESKVHPHSWGTSFLPDLPAPAHPSRRSYEDY